MVKQKLWDLLAQAGLRQDSSLWMQSYRRHLQAEGADEETQRKAMLLQLWATQVSEKTLNKILTLTLTIYELNLQ